MCRQTGEATVGVNTNAVVERKGEGLVWGQVCRGAGAQCVPAVLARHPRGSRSGGLAQRATWQVDITACVHTEGKTEEVFGNR